MVTVSRVRHQFSGCPCGHGEHTGVGMKSWERVVCPECEAIEREEGVLISIDTAARVAMLALGDGGLVRCNGQTQRIVSIAEITKLGGKYSTGYVRIKLRELKP